ncbi:UDP-N-acetylmuramate dehydrogenase [Oceanivirga miroungae]|uniref:UDP-N-acetylenolpyruvoylglucosamine reductase n=1 Tax=Oceanivirga miroungae TaxID=1130046 RepID=A0A6I8MF73_9FUSO|nr:UDP-N-acetylmuramate dehydrogenase [Oceanivirga miroungae]VWL85935.1 MurB family protein [Oceanivirga miroungae]
MKIEKDICMKPFSNMKIGGIAKELIYIENEEELYKVFEMVDKYYLLGNGTNTLINDTKLDISFISLKKLNKIEKKEDKYIYVESGVDLTEFTEFMKKNNLGGLENITGIPGSIGGLINMNAGAYGTTIFDKVEKVRLFRKDLGIVEISKEELGLRYRSTLIKDNRWIVIGAYFRLDEGFDEEKSNDKIEKRKNNHPLEYPNLGSTFKNPENDFAARLISEASLKGYRIGDIEVSEKHPNFLVNKGNAKFCDVMKLIEHVKKVIKNKYDIELELELIIIGDDGKCFNY